MSQIYLAFDGGVAVLRRQESHCESQGATPWAATVSLVGKQCQSLAIDPHQPARVYCGTFEAGLWYSENAGLSWQPSGTALPHAAVMAVAVSPLEVKNGMGLLWAGTEPSALFRSEDGGQTWEEKTALQDLPSKPTWSFPPRPWTHHVRWIEPDPIVADRIFVGIELGGVMRSLDGGNTWEDRKPNSQDDCHTLSTHPQAPGLLYETAGGGFAESHDGGATWQRADRGRRHHYLWGLAVDPGDPNIVVISGSPGPRGAHNNETAEAQLYRRSGDEPWQPLTDGLPGPKGSRAYVLATHRAEPGVFYAATNRDLYRSADGGLQWEKQQIVWPEPFALTEVKAIALTAS